MCLLASPRRGGQKDSKNKKDLTCWNRDGESHVPRECKQPLEPERPPAESQQGNRNRSPKKLKKQKLYQQDALPGMSLDADSSI